MSTHDDADDDDMPAEVDFSKGVRGMFWRPGLRVFRINGEVVRDIRVKDVKVSEDSLIVDLMDGRAISVPLACFPRLMNATAAQRNHWEVRGGGFGIHWPDIDEDLSTEGLLRGAPAPQPH
jgi:hypothetical protein